MQRFIARQNLERFRRLLTSQLDDATRRYLQHKISETRRELALLDAAAEGLTAKPTAGLNPNCPFGLHTLGRRFQVEFEQAAHPYLLLDPRPGLHIVDINDAYSRAAMVDRSKVTGEKLFDVFPDNPDDPTADGVSNLYASLRIAAETGRPHEMAIQHYDVRDPSGRFVTRYWKLVNTPIRDDDDRLLFLLHHVEDVTDEMPRERARTLIGLPREKRQVP